jgi:hypothetical protein
MLPGTLRPQSLRKVPENLTETSKPGFPFGSQASGQSITGHLDRALCDRSSSARRNSQRLVTWNALPSDQAIAPFRVAAGGKQLQAALPILRTLVYGLDCLKGQLNPDGAASLAALILCVPDKFRHVAELENTRFDFSRGFHARASRKSNRQRLESPGDPSNKVPFKTELFYHRLQWTGSKPNADWEN